MFEQPTDNLRFAGSIELAAPKLLVRETADEKAVEVPSADAVWNLVLPTGFEARRSFGSVDRTIPARSPAAWRFVQMVANWGYTPGSDGSDAVEAVKSRCNRHERFDESPE